MALHANHIGGERRLGSKARAIRKRPRDVTLLRNSCWTSNDWRDICARVQALSRQYRGRRKVGQRNMDMLVLEKRSALQSESRIMTGTNAHPHLHVWRDKQTGPIIPAKEM